MATITIAERPPLRHATHVERLSLRLLVARVLALVLAICSITAKAQTQDPVVSLTKYEAKEIITYYGTHDLETTVGMWRRQMPPVVADKPFRASIHRKLPSEMTRLSISDPALLAGVSAVLQPVLSFYGRTAVYDVIVIDSDVPLMMSDSGVIFKGAESDDELLGYAAHEVGHEYFVKYSVYSQHLLRLISEGGKEPILMGKVLSILAIVELQCDVFAALTLASLGYDSLEFVKGLDRTGRDLPNHKAGNHPPDFQRRVIVEAVVPPKASSIKPRRTKALMRLQESLGRRWTSQQAPKSLQRPR